ncbi:MAG TPA: STAS domain-containing protein [Acidimicrobiia bacterium]
MEGLTIRSEDLANGWVSIAVEGEVDLATVDQLQLAIDEVYDDQAEKALVVDLTASSFMDSTGLKALVMSHRRFDGAGRGFAIAVSGGPVSRLIDLSGVNSSIRTVESVSELGEA